MSQTSTPPVLLFTGDSITDSDRLFDERPDKLGSGYVRIIQERLPGASVINRGHNGYTAFQMKLKWEQDCISLCPDTVTLLAGINDLSLYLYGGGYGPEGYRDYLEAMAEETAARTQARLILMEPFIFPWPAEYANWLKPLEGFRQAARTLAEQRRIPFVPLWDIFQQKRKIYGDSQLTVDGIHLTPRGHQIVAEAWLETYANIASATDAAINVR